MNLHAVGFQKYCHPINGAGGIVVSDFFICFSMLRFFSDQLAIDF